MHKKIIEFAANPASIHVQEWLEILPAGMTARIWNIGETHKAVHANATTIQPPTFIKYLPTLAKYVALGLWLRHCLPKGAWLHAHNASGYGLTARLSRRRYAITTYGSEVFGRKDRSRIYQWILRSSLKHAERVTGTSDTMGTELIEEIGLSDHRVHIFSLGVADIFQTSPASKVSRATRPVWIYNRRTTPHYHTLEVISAFERYKLEGREGELIIMRGDSSGSYATEVSREAERVSGITFIENRLSRAEMIVLLDRCDFAISAPSSDQLSAAILESMARGLIPILRPLQSYCTVQDLAVPLCAAESDTDRFYNTFVETSNMRNEEVAKRSKLVKKRIEVNFSRQSAQKKYEILIREMVNINCHQEN